MGRSTGTARKRFDAPAVFGAILDRHRGGFYRIAPACADARPKQLYLPETNVLITRSMAPEGVGEVHDFMPIDAGPQRLVRRVVAVRGLMPFRLELSPRFNYARDTHELRLQDGCARFVSGDSTLTFSGATDLAIERTPGGLVLEFELGAGKSRTFVLQTGGGVTPLGEEQADALERATAEYWRRWLARSTYSGRWRETVHRSALALKLLSYEPTGAMVAAPSTSLPERIGGPRNWDYRFAWVRDVSFSLHALLRLGFSDEAQAFTRFLASVAELNAAQWSGGPMLQVLYGIDPRSECVEQELDHLEGYGASRPVRIGNAAGDQLQLDIYGGLLDALDITERAGSQQLLPYDTWRSLVGVVDWVCEHWQEPDEGIWEVRNGRRRFTYSRVMCWVALDRAIRIAARRGLPAPRGRWTAQRDAIYAWIMERGWSDRRGAFVQSEGSDVLDASLLLMPLVHFVAPTDPRWLSTLDAIGRELVSDSLVYRYDPRVAPDGLDGGEETFSMCTFWYVECLARAGRLEEAQLAFAKVLTYGPRRKARGGAAGLREDAHLRQPRRAVLRADRPQRRAAGQLPHAFTHLGLISAAITLDRQLSRESARPARA